MRSSARGVPLVPSHKNFVENRKALVTQGIAKVAPAHPFVVEMANWLRQEMLLPKEVKIRSCTVEPDFWADPQDTASQKLGVTSEDGMIATQV